MASCYECCELVTLLRTPTKTLEDLKDWLTKTPASTEGRFLSSLRPPSLSHPVAWEDTYVIEAVNSFQTDQNNKSVGENKIWKLIYPWENGLKWCLCIQCMLWFAVKHNLHYEFSWQTRVVTEQFALAQVRDQKDWLQFLFFQWVQYNRKLSPLDLEAGDESKLVNFQSIFLSLKPVFIKRKMTWFFGRKYTILLFSPK